MCFKNEFKTSIIWIVNPYSLFVLDIRDDGTNNTEIRIYYHFYLEVSILI